MNCKRREGCSINGSRRVKRTMFRGGICHSEPRPLRVAWEGDVDSEAAVYDTLLVRETDNKVCESDRDRVSQEFEESRPRVLELVVVGRGFVAERE